MSNIPVHLVVLLPRPADFTAEADALKATGGTSDDVGFATAASSHFDNEDTAEDFTQLVSDLSEESAGDEALEEESHSLEADEDDGSSDGFRENPYFMATMMLSPDASMPEHPIFDGTTIVTPPWWKGEQSGIRFEAHFRPDGAVLAVVIPGEYTSAVSAICTSPEGFLDTYLAFDTALAVATNPNQYSPDFVQDNAMAISFACGVLNESADGMLASIQMHIGAFGPAKAQNDQLSELGKVAAGLKRITARIQTKLNEVSPTYRLAAQQSESRRTIH